MLSSLALATFAGLLIYAACTDAARLIIPNRVSIALALAFPIAALGLGVAPLQVGWHLLVGAGVLAVGFGLFAFNIFGGGDAKLLAATSLWVGADGLLTLLTWTAIAGGLLALALLAARQFVKQTETTPPFVNHLLKQQNGIPYGVAIMCGGLMAIPTLPFV